jgi:hypothetical protein
VTPVAYTIFEDLAAGFRRVSTVGRTRQHPARPHSAPTGHPVDADAD